MFVITNHIRDKKTKDNFCDVIAIVRHIPNLDLWNDLIVQFKCSEKYNVKSLKTLLLKFQRKFSHFSMEFSSGKSLKIKYLPITNKDFFLSIRFEHTNIQTLNSWKQMISFFSKAFKFASIPALFVDIYWKSVSIVRNQ